MTVENLAERRALTAGLVLTVTLVGFESLAVSTALPAITDDLDGVEFYGWVFSAYMLGNLLGIVFAGRAADRHGPARPYLAGLALFAFALGAAALAPAMWFLVAARFLQGIGGGAIPAVVYVAAGRGYPAELQPRVFAIMSTAWVVPGIVGPSISAFITDHIGWRWVFAGLLPFVVVAALLTTAPLRALGRPAVAPAPGADPTRPAIAVAAGVALVLFATGGLPPVIAIAVGVTGAVVARRAYIALTPAGTLRLAPGLPATIALRGMQTFAFFGADAFVPRLIHDVREQSYTVTGLGVTGGTLAWSIAAWIAARRLRAHGPRGLVTTGFAIMACANLLLIVGADPATSVAVAIAGAVGAGFGMGLGYSAVSVTMLDQAEAGREGAASASLSLTDALGIALGTGLGGAFIHLADARGWSSATGLQLACAGPLAVAVAGTFAARMRMGGPQARGLSDLPAPAGTT